MYALLYVNSIINGVLLVFQSGKTGPALWFRRRLFPFHPSCTSGTVKLSGGKLASFHVDTDQAAADHTRARKPLLVAAIAANVPEDLIRYIIEVGSCLCWSW